MGEKHKPRYILLISIHGLIRGHDLELGRDADTGGQTKYVVDLARSLAERDDVDRVDLVTRRIKDPEVSADYARVLEELSPKARIVRIEAGPEQYIPKEQLWDHLENFTDNLSAWLHEQPVMPDVLHSHYADAGYVGVHLSHQLGIPLVHTGHSLGRDKRRRLLARGLGREKIEQTYNMARRIDAEEEVLANAALVITSTHNEIEDQYALYDFYDPERMRVIPPGTDLEQFHPPTAREKIPFAGQLEHFLRQPQKPLVLALSRPDERKNILTLIEAFGESAELQERANLLIVAGSRDEIRDLNQGAQEVMKNILLLIDKYDLYGRVAIPKSHKPEEVPQIYRLVAQTGGVFINPALAEPFGLTLLEAAASGLPLVATENGGPVDIIGNCRCGKLVDPLDKEAISSALLYYLTDAQARKEAVRNGIEGVRRHYSWQAHAEKYLAALDQLEEVYSPLPVTLPDTSQWRFPDRAIFTDLDQSLIGDDEALGQFIAMLRAHRKQVTFGITTGRRIDSALKIMRNNKIPRPDVLISSLGTRIHYGPQLTEDEYWADHIDHNWTPSRIARLLASVPGLEMQPRSEQTPFKISYYYDAGQAPGLEDINHMLRQREITATVNLSFGQFLDITPSRASKGQALRYVTQILDIPLERTLVAGGSSSDEDMLRGNTLSVIVNNRHHNELSNLAAIEEVYVAERPCAAGLLEAIEHFDFFNRCCLPASHD